MTADGANLSVDFDGQALPVTVDAAASTTSSGGVVILAHGAGGSAAHATTRRLAGVLNAIGWPVVRFDFPYRAAGRKVPDRMPTLQRAYDAVRSAVLHRYEPERLWLGGHSMGGRVASMLVADGIAADGLVLFAYPWHPPGRPERPRTAHLRTLTTRTLCFNGTRDPFCTRVPVDDLVSGLPHWTQHWVEGADHSYGVLKRSGRTPADVDAELREACAAVLNP